MVMCFLESMWAASFGVKKLVPLSRTMEKIVKLPVDVVEAVPALDDADVFFL